MAEEENLYEDPELKIISRFDRIRDKKVRRDRFQNQIDMVGDLFLIFILYNIICFS